MFRFLLSLLLMIVSASISIENDSCPCTTESLERESDNLFDKFMYGQSPPLDQNENFDYFGQIKTFFNSSDIVDFELPNGLEAVGNDFEIAENLETNTISQKEFQSFKDNTTNIATQPTFDVYEQELLNELAEILNLPSSTNQDPLIDLDELLNESEYVGINSDQTPLDLSVKSSSDNELRS